ncbi:MAG: LicD family protein [Synergistaceae bacterium]|nr:LicD family protein [Candidatus Equadaptatus faecalis]
MDIRKVQLVQLDILKQVIKICEKYNITYFAAYGTLLGAVRHKGFIPWDDDVDLMMPRLEYERFCEIAKQELEYPYFLQINRTDPFYTMHIARVLNLETAHLYPATDRRKPGLFIDIYPLDGIKHTDLFHRSIFKIKYRFYKYCAIDLFHQDDYFGKGIKRTLGKFINKYFYHNQNGAFFHEKQEKLYKETPYAVTEYVVIYHSWHILKKAWLKDVVLLDFEDIQLHCPIGYDALLKYMYGSYMIPLPKNQRYMHHLVK